MRRPEVAVVLGLAAAKLAVQLAALTPYGWFRDELYYLACADHLAWGYVDHPPFSIALLAAWRAVLGASLVSVRLVPALAGAALVGLTALLARRLGGGLVAIAVAGAAVLLAPGYFGFDHYYSMNALDHLLWVAAAHGVVTCIERPRTRSFVVLGALLGVGLLNKWSVLWLGAGLAVALAVPPRWADVRSRGPWIAAALALAFFAPHVVWQVHHGWPTLEFMRNAIAEKYVPRSFGSFVKEAFLLANPMSVPLVAFALVAPFRDATLARFRALPVAFLCTFFIVASSRSGKAEYLLSAFPLVFAMGAVGLERALAALGTRARVAILGALGLPALSLAAIALPFGLPVLSEDAFVAYQARLGLQPSTTERHALARLPQFYADMHGWTELVDATAAAVAQLTPAERARVKILARTGGYGPAAAIDVLGRARGLPRAIGGHNSYWLWGFGDDDRTVVVLLGGKRDDLDEFFESVTAAGIVECGDCMPYENHKPIWIGRGLKRPWAEVWPRLRHFD